MGHGRFVNGKLVFLVSTAYVPSASERTLWRDSLQRASDFLFAATGGQVQFGDVYMVEDGLGRLSAEMLLFEESALSGGTRGEFGVPGATVNYYRNDRGNSQILVHELSHHVWNLGDEYSRPMEEIEVDTSSPAPDRRTIPVVGPLAPALVGEALLRFDGNYARRRIASNTADRIVVDADYPDLPTNSTRAYIQRSASCGQPRVSGADFCIMEETALPSVSNFCDAANHDAGQDTDQQVTHGTSCWDTILSTSGFTSLAVPAAPASSPPEPVNFIDVLTEPRFVLAFDRSGSMGGDKLAYAKEGARFWIDSCTLAGDLLSVIAYNANNTVLLPLTSAGSIADAAALETELDAVSATGRTNVRDALREGVTQITSEPGRSVTQAIVVLTDGKHNRPVGSRLIEAAPDLVEAGVLAATIAIGEGSGVDAAELDDLAYETGGYFALVGLSNPIDVQTALIEANLFLRGGLVDAEDFDFVPAPPDERAEKSLTQLYKRWKSPRLEDVLEALGIAPRSLKSARSFAPYSDLFAVTTFHVERGCERLACAINHHLDADFDLFLVDPGGHSVPATAADVRRAAGPAHRLMAIREPPAGVWTAVVLARVLQPGAPVTSVKLSAGAEHRRLVVTGGSTRSVYRTNESARLHARARWDADLTGLRVDARIARAGGEEIEVALADGDAASPSSGRYEADLPPLPVGQYKGVISLQAPARSNRANLLHVAAHSRAAGFSTGTSCPRFQRKIPFYFEVAKGR